MKPIVTFEKLGINGRLGNQLSQMAACIGFAVKHGYDYKFPTWSREGIFNIDGCFGFVSPVQSTYNEPFFHYQEIPNVNANIYGLFGFFQSYKYIEHCESLIKYLFHPRRDIVQKSNVTGIHVRRGDYVSLPDYHPCKPLSYYQRAMEITGGSSFLIASDDMDWCRANFIGSQFDFVDGNSDMDDFCELLGCENMIIANSSFSYWIAYLNKNPNKKVVAPLNWFGPKITHDTKDLCPPNWIRI